MTKERNMTEANEVIEEIKEEVLDATEETVESFHENKPTKKHKKHTEAKKLVEKAKSIVKDADEQTEACKLLLVGDLKEYEEAKESLKSGGLEACALLLGKLGEEHKNSIDNEKVIVFETKDDIKPIALKNVSSGRFTGLLMSLFAGTATAVGLAYLASQKLGMLIDFKKVPTVPELEKILTWFSTIVGQEPNMYLGAGILGGISLLVMGIVYSIRVGMKGRKNLHFAAKQYAEAEIYTEQKGNCKTEMDKVDAHMKETVNTLKTFEVLFNEQKGKLERILHIEGDKEQGNVYHSKSNDEIHTTKELLRTIKDFIATPMSEEGKLSERSVLFLYRAKNQMNKILEKLY
jgi:hypothetical protein